MKSKWNLFASIFQVVIGLLAVITFLVIMNETEDMTKWIITLLLSIGYIVLGILGIIGYVKSK